MTIIEKNAKELIVRYVKQISAYNKSINISGIEKRQYNFEVTVQSSGEKLKVQVYFGKKGVRTVLQGSDSTALYGNINSLINSGAIKSAAKERLSEPKFYIGTDESGKGDYFGPLVSASVVANENQLAELKKIGVKDSKELSDYTINSMANEIVSDEICDYKIKILLPADYNKKYDEINNLNRLLDYMHSSTIEPLIINHKCRNVIIDKYSKKGLSLEENYPEVKFEYFTKGERFTAVAAASILARASFNLWFEKTENAIYPKGAGSEVDKVAKMLYETEGMEKLKNVAKIHFKTTKKIF